MSCEICNEQIFPFWSKISRAEQEILQQGSVKVQYEKGTLIHRSEESCKGIMYVMAGQLRTYILSDEGREVTLFRVREREVCIMSASCLMEAIAFDVMIEAVEDTTVVMFPSTILAGIMGAHPEAELYIYKSATERFTDVIWMMQQILFMGADRRIAIFLWDEIAKTGSLVLHYTHDEIARFIGSAREVVTRMLKYFAQGGTLKLSSYKSTPKWLVSKGFRYGFLVFFLVMFANMIFQTYLVAAGAGTLKESLKLFWTIRVPWDWAYTAGTVADWVAQFSFGFYSIMLTSTIIGLIVMVLFRPRTWCGFCPMGTMTQLICKIKK